MAVKKIVVPIRGDGKGESVLTHAAALARRHAAHIEAVHCRAGAGDMLPYGVVVPAMLRDQIARQASILADEEERALRDEYTALMVRIGLELTGPETPPDDRASASWVEEQGRQLDVIRVHGRLADLVAVAKPDRDRNLGMNTLRAALFHTGRPVLVCPPVAASDGFGAHMAIAWNGSLEVARVTALAMPLLCGADRVTILDGGSEHSATDGAAFERYLATHGVQAERVAIKADSAPGQVILAETSRIGADILVMGAYHHSREHEMIFGGATQHIVDQMQCAVVMAH